jgi:hypothetical protein
LLIAIRIEQSYSKKEMERENIKMQADCFEKPALQVTNVLL